MTSRWVSVDSAMPDDGVYVLCTDEDLQKNLPAADDIYVAAWDDKQGFWTTDYWGDHDWLSKVSPRFWASLPEPPND